MMLALRRLLPRHIDDKLISSNHLFRLTYADAMRSRRRAQRYSSRYLRLMTENIGRMVFDTLSVYSRRFTPLMTLPLMRTARVPCIDENE